jgi:hypothetical protein
MANKISGNLGNVANVVVTYTHAKGAIPPQNAVADGSGNHASPALPIGVYAVSATDPSGLVVFNTVAVPLDGTSDVAGVNLRSRAKNASNAQAL